MKATQQNHLSTWAEVKIKGSGTEAGFVSTQYFGAVCMFQIDVPAIPDKESVLSEPKFINGKMVPPGTTVKQLGEPGRSRIVNASLVHEITPCDQKTVIAAMTHTSWPSYEIVSPAPDDPPTPSTEIQHR
jgi:hypothetical protein